jgi:hypothetical protein
MANGWWGNWRPSLPAHTGDLQPTDLIECTSMSGGVPTNTVITGQQIIDAAQGGGSSATWGGITGTLSSQTDLQTALNAKQDTLVSGTNIKTINSTSLLGSGNITINPRTLTSSNGSNLTGTANQISASVLIPANTLVTNNTIYIKNLLTKTVGSTASTARIYINTSNSLSGATQIATAASMTSTNYHQRFERNIFFDGTNLNIYSPSNGIANDLTAGVISLYSFNPAVNHYLIFAVQNSTTTPDNLGWKRVIVQIYD